MDLNIRLISENNLSPDEYVYLYIVYKNAQNLLDKVKLKYDPADLQLRGWVNENTVTEKFLDLFVSDVDVMFAELISIYPNRVTTSSGNVRVLCAKNPDAASNKKAKKRYSKLVANKPHIHKYIIRCLNNQLKVQDIAYMQNIETWLNNYTWEKYENVEDGEKRERISRKL